MIDKIQALISERTGLRLGINKINELARLVYEISRRENISFASVLDVPAVSGILDKKSAGYLAKFSNLKKYLIERRYPNACAGADFDVYFSRMKTPGETVKKYSGRFFPEKIFIEQEAEQYPLAKRVRKIFGSGKCETIESLKSSRKANPSSVLDPKKRELFVTVEKWDFVKPCPCTKNVVRCGYHVINLGFGCPYDCSYCFLQQYSNSPGIVITANLSDYFPLIEAYLKKHSSERVRIGTGEFTDSLALDHITGYSKELVRFFAGKNATLELKTKSDNIENLIGIDHGDNTVVLWSLNPQKLCEAEELGAASLSERLAAAKKCRAAGYGVGFHFDPIIHYEGWENEYKKVVNDMFDAVPDPKWISLGTLRFHRTLKDVIEARSPESDYIYGELTLGEDNKMRYYESLRKDIFLKMNSWIRKRSASSEVYLCMEAPGMWLETLGKTYPCFNRKES